MIEVTARENYLNESTVYTHKVTINTKNHSRILEIDQRAVIGENGLSIEWSIGSSSTLRTIQELEQIAMDYVRVIQIMQTIGNKTDQDYSLKFKNK